MNKWIALLLAAILLTAGLGSAFAEEVKGKFSIGLGGGLFDVAQENKYLTIGKEFTAKIKYGFMSSFEVGIMSGYSACSVSDRLSAFPHRLFKADGTALPYAPWGASTLENDGRFRWDKSSAMDVRLQRIPLDVFVQFRAMETSFFNPYLLVGGGLEFWSVRDGGSGDVLQIDMSEGDSVINSNGQVLLSGSYPKQAFQGTQGEFMVSVGAEVFPIDHVGIDVSAKARWPFGRDFFRLGLDMPQAYIGVDAMVTFYYGGSYDSDKDGVNDKDDKCPDTQIGCVVDQFGCPVDTDVDGVCDGLDQCPNTGKGCKVDAKGCPTDTDNDGVCDGVDKCPNTALGARVDASGCESGDDDKDGVLNSKDDCPNTPQGCLVDAKGCPLDADGDGVCDGLDRCPNTPKGVVVLDNGCPKLAGDQDGDGVLDDKDKCPNTSRGCQVDSLGCPLDVDKDGVCDGLDKCPKTPACAMVDATGCPMDADGDGVYDGCDKCPNTPKLIDGKPVQVDSMGCARIDYTKKAVESDKGLQVRIEFDEGKFDIKSSEAIKLMPVIEVMKAIPELKLEVGGHTNSNGSDASNQTLSERRAKGVRDYLVSAGISGDRITTEGYGERQLVDNDGERITKSGKKEDKTSSRRIEFHRTDKNPEELKK